MGVATLGEVYNIVSVAVDNYRGDCVIFELSNYEHFNNFSFKIKSFPVALKKLLLFN